MQKFAPCLWFDDQAMEAANFYTSVFKNSKVECVTHYLDGAPMPRGSVLTVRFSLDGQEFNALNGGPYFTITPAISFFVYCEMDDEITELWEKLSAGGAVLMELDKYPFGEKFGWVQDKFGVSWQLILSGHKQKITPFLMFVGEQHGKAEEAMNFYCSVFDNSSIETIERYDKGEQEPAGTVKHAVFTLGGQEFMAMDSGLEHTFTFSEAISFYIYCRTQAEIDELWEKLTADGEASQCGWLKDRFGVSWQIVTDSFEEMINDSDPEKAQRVMDALLKMKKIDLQALKDAYEKS